WAGRPYDSRQVTGAMRTAGDGYITHSRGRLYYYVLNSLLFATIFRGWPNLSVCHVERSAWRNPTAMMLTGAESKHPENAYAGDVDAGNSPHGLSRTRQPAAPALVQILPLEIRFPSARVSPMLDTSSGCFDSALQVLL